MFDERSTTLFSAFNAQTGEDVVLPFRLMSIGHMIRHSEMRMIYHLARDCLKSGQHILDAGTFLGASAAAMAAGLAARPDRETFYRSIHAYDRFKNSSEFYGRYLHGCVEPEGSFFGMFLENVDPYTHYINAYCGDFLSFNWIGKPIGIFFNDVSKSPQLDAHIWRYYEPYWTPGETYYVQQDFVHLQAPFVQIALGALAEYFSFLAVVTPSLVLGYRQRIPSGAIASALELAKSADLAGQLKAIDKLIDRILPMDRPETIATLQLLQVILQNKHGTNSKARADWLTINETYGDLQDNYYRARARKVGRDIGILPPHEEK